MTNGQLYTIVPNELNPSFEKWVYNDNGQYIHIPSSLMGSYFKLIKEEEGAAKEMNVEEMNIDELYHLQSKLKEQINKEVIKAVVDVNNTLELLKDNLDVLFNVCQMFDIQVDSDVENLQYERKTCIQLERKLFPFFFISFVLVNFSSRTLIILVKSSRNKSRIRYQLPNW